MLSLANVPSVADDELLARYLTHNSERRNNGTVKPILFVPYTHIELSVNRHLECREEEIWHFGNQVAESRNRTLIGRCDITAASCRAVAGLDVKKSPIIEPSNPNHADIHGYPAVKSEQMSIAQKLVATATNCVNAPET